MHDSSRPTDTPPAPTAWELAGRPAAPTSPPQSLSRSAPPTEPAAVFGGRTPGRSSAVRAGIVLGSALVLAVGTAVVMGASPSSPAPSNQGGAAPSSAPSAAPNDDGNGRRGPSANGPFGGFGPFGLLPVPFAAGQGNGSSVPGFGRGPGGFGRFGGIGYGEITVTAISGDELSLQTADGWTRTITVTQDTKITKGGQPATLADVMVGDTVRFAETKNDDGTWTITALAVVLPQTAGTVTAVGNDSITITGKDGTSQTIHTTDATTYHRGNAGGSRSDVTVGAIIVATGERGSDGSLTATSVTVIPARVIGTVASVSGDTITVTRRDGTTITLHVSADTTVGVAGVDGASIADVKPGMAIAAEGSQRSDGSLDAIAIRAGQRGGLRGPDAPKAGHDANPSRSPSSTTG
jgi:Domain of unknown function (DUF5666)